MAQPPLSRQIKQLEERLGVALFERHSKGLALTDEGVKVLEIIRPLLQLREETLARLAKRIANQVKATGRPRTLEPMNPYERRVLHATLQNNPYVATRSEGEEPNRRVVIYPKNMDE